MKLFQPTGEETRGELLIWGNSGELDSPLTLACVKKAGFDISFKSSFSGLVNI